MWNIGNDVHDPVQHPGRSLPQYVAGSISSCAGRHEELHGLSILSPSHYSNMPPRALLSLLLSVAPALAIPPPDFGFPEAPNHTELSVTYRDNGNPIVVTEAELFGVGSK